MAGAVTDAEEEEADDETAEGGACGGLDRPRPADGAASPPPEPPSAMALASKPYCGSGTPGIMLAFPYGAPPMGAAIIPPLSPSFVFAAWRYLAR
mmetsp:Transcript_29097/g.67645  ORF Transcript_29097/g.67645 Transcript_29097/m.67645 type:complete len:95 (-) Transcript_29097:307-591(-)